MERCNVDVSATRLEHGMHPLIAQARHDCSWIASFKCYAAARELGQESVDCSAVLGASDVKRAEWGQHTCRLQQRPRGRRERLDAGTAVGFGPESRRSTGGVIARLVLGLDQQDRCVRRKFGR